MTVDRHAARFLRMFSAAGTTRAYGGPGDRRRALEDLAAIADYDPAPVAAVAEIEVAGAAGSLNARAYTPLGAGKGALPTLIYFHGGGWVAGDLDTHDGVCRRLANASGCRVIAVDYRRAPEHPFPAAFEDAVAATADVAARAQMLGVNVSRLGVAGDSAGAGLAAAVCQHVARNGGPALALQLLICPILDVANEATSRREFAEGYFLDQASMRGDLACYLGALPDLADPRVSPGCATDLAGLPPALIHTAEYDPFRDEGEAYAARLSAAGVDAVASRHPGMIHYFYAMPRTIPAAVGIMDEIGASVRAVMTPELRRVG